MKKSILGLAALALLASCNNDEELNSLAPEAITFGNPFVDNATRAIASDDSYSGTGVLNSFQVWGNVISQDDTALEVFKDNAVSGTVGTGSVWKVNKQEYWIWGATYNFAAVVNADKVNDASVVALGANLLPAKITYTADNGNTKDLLYAEALNVTRSAETEDKKVPMQFSHLLSKVKFTAVNETSDTDYTFNIKNITITNSAAKGYYYPQTYTEGGVTTAKDTWKIDGTGSTTFGAIDGVEYTTNTDTKFECAKEKLLIPADYTSTELSVSYTIEWCYNGSVITSASKTSTASVNLQKGYAYNFIIKTGINSPIQFSVESKPGWTENPGGGLEI